MPTLRVFCLACLGTVTMLFRLFPRVTQSSPGTLNPPLLGSSGVRPCIALHSISPAVPQAYSMASMWVSHRTVWCYVAASQLLPSRKLSQLSSSAPTVFVDKSYEVKVHVLQVLRLGSVSSTGSLLMRFLNVRRALGRVFQICSPLIRGQRGACL